MPTAHVLQFMHKTAEDESLRIQLEQLIGVGDGNISSQDDLDPDEAAVLKGTQAPAVVEFAAAHGFDFTTDDLIAVVEAFEKHQTGELSDEDFSELLGHEIPDSDHDDHDIKIKNPLKRLSQYLGKTYLGLGSVD